MQALQIYVAPRAGNPRVPRALFRRIHEAVLGPSYELSVAFLGARAMRELNRRYRKKLSSTDVLSFPLSKHSGEIVFSLRDAREQAPRFGRPTPNFLIFLFIHGLLHLKGYEHGSKMEEQEQKFRNKFNI